MKIRQGFVSNSSSTMFVIAFPEKPTSLSGFRHMLFKDIDERTQSGIRCKNFCRDLWNQIQLFDREEEPSYFSDYESELMVKNFLWELESGVTEFERENEDKFVCRLDVDNMDNDLAQNGFRKFPHLQF